ncbi:MAG: flagellar filament capping protein FliD [Nitrospinae bacterium]|nr:flagellar filament capping protein FliD [Nitrospinota bacterium]MBL7019711.1 flagellar filament capping protein FliD [Nitrospinaceae bacterium]
MQVLNNANPTFFPLNSTRSTSNDLNVRIARDTINRAGSPRETKRDILFESVFINKRKVPTLEATGPLATFRVADVIALLSRQSASRKIPIVDDLDKKERFTLLKLRQLDDLSTSLRSLGQTVADLLADDALNPKRASSTRSQLVQAVAGKDAPLDSFRLTPVQLSQAAILASDEQSIPLGALGLTGSFSINGTKITVEATDSLFELKNKINFGEDQNRNGILDKTEDVNNNGTLDIIRSANSEFVPALFIAEDFDGDGEIDPDEDVNNNSQLDGGTLESRVLALIQGNRLILVGLAGGRTKIDLQDDDNVLLGLGFFELNIKGFPIQKEVQFDSDNIGVNLIQEPQTAKIEINGKQVSSDNNVFSGVIEDTDLVIKQASEKAAQINISIDAATFFSQIKILVDQFNNSISKINDLLGVSRTFKRDGDIQDIRNDLTFKPQARVRELDQRNENIDRLRGRPGNPFATGIEVVNTEKNSAQEVAVTTAAQAVKSGIARAFQSEDEKLLRRLGAIGIRTLTDNTFALDEKEFRRGLDSNTVEVFDLFTNSETGILPSLAETLTSILRDELGELAIKENEIVVQSRSPRTLAANFRKFTENTNLENTIQTLIAVA